ncbi:hypothetical protein [Streptomyces sp. NPDC096132]
MGRTPMMPVRTWRAEATPRSSPVVHTVRPGSDEEAVASSSEP